MEFLYYLLEANLYLLVLYGFYLLFLKKETFYQLNRVFIIGAVGIAFLIPLFQIGILKSTPTHLFTNFESSESENSKNYPDFIILIYALITMIMGIRLFFNLFQLYKLTKNSEKIIWKNISFYNIANGKDHAFSFFNLLYVNNTIEDKQTVVNHEMTHMKQYHTVDVLVFEILSIICWFNPATHFMKQDIKLLHEYLADENAASNKHEYALFLINNSFHVSQHLVTSHLFNQSFLKRRIHMLNQKKSSGKAKLRLFLVLPLTAGMLCISTMSFTKSYGLVDIYPNQDPTKTQAPPPPKKGVKKDQTKYPPPVVAPDQKTVPPPPRVEPPPPRKAVKKDQIKYPPPIVTPDQKTVPPPPRVEPPPPRKAVKKDQIKYPPPVVVPDKNIAPPAPKKSVKKDQIKYPPPVVVPDKNIAPPAPKKV